MKLEETIIARVPAEVKACLTHQAAEMGRSASWLVRQILEVYVNDLKEKKRA